MTTETASDAASLAAIYRYPVKGLSADPLEQAELTPGGTLAWDRAFAIENGGREFDPLAPRFLPKSKFLMLARDERLAALQCRFDEAETSLTVLREGKQVARANLMQPVGRQLLEQFFAAYLGQELRGAPHVVHAEGHSFSDIPDKVVSIINLASVRDIERVARRSVDPLRFRGNLYLEGVPAWREADWVGQKIRVGGDVWLQVREPIGRCAATEVDPHSGQRDIPIPRTLMDAYGHMNCGVYAQVISLGTIAAGDPVAVPTS